jgi:hypothetical protein
MVCAFKNKEVSSMQQGLINPGPDGSLVQGIRRLGPVRPLLDPLTWRSAIYLLVSFVFGLIWTTGLLIAIPMSLALVIVWIGIPLLALTMLLWRGAARLERHMIKAAFGIHIPAPYRPLPPGNLLRKWRALSTDPATWKDLAYLLLLLPVSLFEFAFSFGLWGLSLSLVSLPLLFHLLKQEGTIQVTIGNWTTSSTPRLKPCHGQSSA